MSTFLDQVSLQKVLPTKLIIHTPAMLIKAVYPQCVLSIWPARSDEEQYDEGSLRPNPQRHLHSLVRAKRLGHVYGADAFIIGELILLVDGAAKGAQTSLAKGLALEAAPHNIKINALAPLGVTPNAQDAQKKDMDEISNLMKDCKPVFVSRSVFLCIACLIAPTGSTVGRLSGQRGRSGLWPVLFGRRRPCCRVCVWLSRSRAVSTARFHN
jgi:hypothetical protein